MAWECKGTRQCYSARRNTELCDKIGHTDIVFDNELTFRPRNTIEALNSKLDVKVG
jgi:hypothetical protein